MFRLNEKEAIDFVEADLLYCWGCSDYASTLIQLTQLAAITVDPAIKGKCEALQLKLLLCCSEDSYQQLYGNIRVQAENSMKSKLRFAKELLEIERKAVA